MLVSQILFLHALYDLQFYSNSAHTANGTHAAGKQTNVAVKTDNGIKAGKKTTVGAYRNKKE